MNTLIRQAFAVLLAAALSAGAFAGAAPRVLVLGGGYDLSHNQAAIESNVRYLDRLLPKGAAERVLFADGRRQTKNVLCEDTRGRQYYRRPQLPRLDGPSALPAIEAEFRALASGPASEPVLLYTTGHGSPGAESSNNDFDLWDNGHLSVHRLAAQIKTLPASVPVILVMVQCFSGSFGNLLFEGGNPKAPLASRDLCGFFAAVAERPAAGCTPAVNEAEYRDFTGYFFAALSGADRLGRAVTGADYNYDGFVGMDEAFAYTLVHDDSIDTPVCTSDVFLRRFVPTVGGDFAQAQWADLIAWATPAQRAALAALSDDLHLRGEERLASAYRRFEKMDVRAEDLPSVRLLRFVRLAKTVVLAHRLVVSVAPSDRPLQERFRRLTAAEARSCLSPPAAGERAQVLSGPSTGTFSLTRFRQPGTKE